MHHHKHIHLAIASPSQIEDTARQLTAIRESFLTNGTLTISPPRPLILESWQRCHSMHVNPARQVAPLAIAHESQLSHLREANELLMRATRSVMSRLTDFLADSGYVIVLSDANGYLLDVIGDATIRRRLARIDFVPGGDWNEAAAGTNAIGTALADGHVVQLMASEHYCDGWQDLTCTAAPIRHPVTGKVIGILDVTGNYRLIRPFLTNTLAEAALDVSQQLRLLLTATHREVRSTIFYPASASFTDGTSTLKNNNSVERYCQQAEKHQLILDDICLRLNQQERRTHGAERLAAAASAISASLDIDVALEKVAEHAAYLFQLECATVCLFDEEDEDNLSLHTWSKQKSEHVLHLPTLETLFAKADALSLIRERGELVVIDDALASPLLPIALAEQLSIGAIALFPLMVARGVIGFIAVSQWTPYRWLAEDVRLGVTLAAQSATAIENARLFAMLQQHNRRMEVFNTMAQLLSTLPDPNQHLDLILKRITQVMNLDAGMILLSEQMTGELKLVAHCGLPETIPLHLSELPLRPLSELACLVLATGESLLACSMNCNERIVCEPLRAAGFCDLMVVPLASGNTILGVLLVGSHTHQGLTEEDLRVFTTIGQQLGLTLKNAQLLRAASEMEALRQADRLKSSFIAAISHDLRSPLTAIRASVESLLDRDGIQPMKAKDHLLHNIAGQASRLGRLVDQLLDLSRIEAGALALDRDWTELPALIADTLVKFEGLNSGCPVECILAEDLPLHYVDPDRLVQVLWNLLENASKYAVPHSSIKLEAQWTGSEVLIGVADHGPGIPIEERAKIFQHFYRLNRDHRTHTQGSGLGLAICQGIVEAHGGRIWVEDRPEGGSIFYFTLPLAKTDPLELEALKEHELVA